jgi:hypothetical protein
MKAYRVITDKTITNKKVLDYLWDVEEDFTNKERAIAYAKKWTEKTNVMFLTDYNYIDLFGEIKYEGWCYCKRCDSYYWSDESCCC